MRLRTLSVPLRFLGGLLFLLALSCPSFPSLAQARVAVPAAASHAARPAATRPMLRRRLPVRRILRLRRRILHRHRFAHHRRASSRRLVDYRRGLPLRRARVVVIAQARKPFAIIIPAAPPLPDPAPVPAAVLPEAASPAAPAPPVFGPLHPSPPDAPASAPAALPLGAPTPDLLTPPVRRRAPAKPRVAVKHLSLKPTRTAKASKPARLPAAARKPAPRVVSAGTPRKAPPAPVGTWINLNANTVGPLGESAWVNLAQAGNIRFYRTGKTSFAAVGVGGGSYVSTSDPAEIQILRSYVLSHRIR